MLQIEKLAALEDVELNDEALLYLIRRLRHLERIANYTLDYRVESKLEFLNMCEEIQLDITSIYILMDSMGNYSEYILSTVWLYNNTYSDALKNRINYIVSECVFSPDEGLDYTTYSENIKNTAGYVIEIMNTENCTASDLLICIYALDTLFYHLMTIIGVFKFRDI